MLARLLLLLINFCCPIVALLAQSQQEAVPAASAASGMYGHLPRPLCVFLTEIACSLSGASRASFFSPSIKSYFSSTLASGSTSHQLPI